MNFTEKLPLLMGEKDTIYGARMLLVAHCGNFWRSMPLAPVMMFAVRVPDVANSIIADQACSSVY